MRLKLFQGVLGSYKIAGRENFVNKIDTNPPGQQYTLKAGGQHVLDYKGRRKGCKAN